jgi:predicted nucleotide-binding protein
MSLQTRATADDIQALCSYLATKPTGATDKDIEAVVDKKHLHLLKLAALREWKIIETDGNKTKATAVGREYLKSAASKVQILSSIIRNTQPYLSIVERASHRHEDTLTANDVAAHWHDHYKDDVSTNDQLLTAQVITFFQLASAAGLGTLIIGRKGEQTRFSFNNESIAVFIAAGPSGPAISLEHVEPPSGTAEAQTVEPLAISSSEQLGQAIFIAHGKNKKPLEQLKKILDQFHIPCRVATDEPNLGRPISGKVREIMKSCNCAILIFSADEEFKDKDGQTIWRPSENVVHELGATAFLYDNRIVIMKEEGVAFPTNFRDLGYITFEKDQLEATALDILKELIGFGIVKIST